MGPQKGGKLGMGVESKEKPHVVCYRAGDELGDLIGRKGVKIYS